MNHQLRGRGKLFHYVSGSDDDGTDYSGIDGNVGVDPVLDSDYKLTVSSPTTVTEGGLTTGIVTIDIEGTARTTPYSMGAFELD